MEPKKVLLPPLHIKLGLVKQFVKKLNPESDAFKHIQELFPKLSEAKVKAGIFVGPQVKRLMKSDSFSEKLSAVERRAWKSFVSVVEGFLGNHKADNFRNIVEELVDVHEKMGCRMALKLYVLQPIFSCASTSSSTIFLKLSAFAKAPCSALSYR